jgi:serine/threonine protein kinase
MSHPNIIKVTDLIDDGETVAFVMEYVEGETLKEYIERKEKLSDEEIKSIFLQMLDAVGYVHEQNLVHRDIKPSNFMIDTKSKVKLMDFGIAKNTDTNSAEYTQTGTGVQMGTPMYMSPEQITETKSVTPQSDIYSLGVVLWQLVTGEKPYDTKTLSTFQLQMKIVQEELPLTNTNWDTFIIKATSKNNENRFSSCKEFSLKLNTDNNTLQVYESDKTIVNSFQNSEKTIIENKVLIDESYPSKVEEYLKQLFYEKGLESFGEIMDNMTMVNSKEYDVFWTVETISASDTAIIYFKLENISFLIGSYGEQWRIVFNGQSYLDLKEIEHLIKFSLSIQSKVVMSLISMINEFKVSSLYLGLNKYNRYIKEWYASILHQNYRSQKICEASLEERMLEEIEKLSDVFSILIGKSYYLQEIPDKKKNNFWNKFKDFIPDSNTSFYWYYDDTIFGKGDDGIAIVKTSEGQWLLLIADLNSPVGIIELVSSSDLFSGEYKNFDKLHSINGDAQKSRFDENGIPFNKFLTLIVVDEDNELDYMEFTGFSDREKINALCDFWVAMEYDPL